MSVFQATAVFWWILLRSHCGSSYELQDTIHTLKEENLLLQHRLQNLTRALRELKHLLIEHSKASEEEQDPEYLHVWREWSQHGISAETHQQLKQALCLSELYNTANLIFISPGIIIFSSLVSVILITALDLTNIFNHSL